MLLTIIGACLLIALMIVGNILRLAFFIRRLGPSTVALAPSPPLAVPERAGIRFPKISRNLLLRP